MPRLTAAEAAELEIEEDKEEIDVSTEQYLRKRDALLEAAETTYDAAQILERYPDPAQLEARELEERRAAAPYEGYGREHTQEEAEAFHKELDAAPNIDAATEVLKKYGRLEPRDR